MSFLLVLASAIIMTPPTPSDLPRFDTQSIDSATLSRLADVGAMIVVDRDEAGDVELVSSAVLVEAPPKRVWTAITDFADYPDFMPQTQETVVREREDGIVEVDFTLKFKFSVVVKRVEYTNTYWLFEDEQRVVFRNSEGGGGEFQIVPVSDDACVLIYSSITHLEKMGALVKTMVKEQPAMGLAIQVSTASVAAEAIKQRAEEKEPDA